MSEDFERRGADGTPPVTADPFTYLAECVKAMRTAQRRYHTCPTVEALLEVRALEKQVDALLGERLSHSAQ